MNGNLILATTLVVAVAALISVIALGVRINRGDRAGVAAHHAAEARRQEARSAAREAAVGTKGGQDGR